MTESRLKNEVDLELQSAFWAATWCQLFPAPYIPASLGCLAGPTAEYFCQQIQAAMSGSPPTNQAGSHRNHKSRICLDEISPF